MNKKLEEIMLRSQTDPTHITYWDGTVPELVELFEEEWLKMVGEDEPEKAPIKPKRGRPSKYAGKSMTIETIYPLAIGRNKLRAELRALIERGSEGR